MLCIAVVLGTMKVGYDGWLASRIDFQLLSRLLFVFVEPNSAPFGDTAQKRNDRFGALVALPISRRGSRSSSRLTIEHGGFKSTALPMDAHLALIYRAITTTSCNRRGFFGGGDK